MTPSMTEMSFSDAVLEKRYLRVSVPTKNGSRFLDLVPMTLLWNIGSM